MKKVGIVVDNYKLRTFKRALASDSFEFETKPFLAATTLITMEVEATKVTAISKICKKLQIDFKHSN